MAFLNFVFETAVAVCAVCEGAEGKVSVTRLKPTQKINGKQFQPNQFLVEAENLLYITK